MIITIKKNGVLFVTGTPEEINAVKISGNFKLGKRRNLTSKSGVVRQYFKHFKK